MKTHVMSVALAATMIAGAAAAAPIHTRGAGSSAVPAEAVTAIRGSQFAIVQVTPEYWRVVINNPPFNIFGPESIPQLDRVITKIENDPKLKVVVFTSAVPGVFLTHYDFDQPLERTTELPAGQTGLPPLPDMLFRLSRAPVVSIVSIRGRATGVGSELALASDMRFASREKALVSQFEIGAGFVPGGGPSARLPRLMGRGRALEILVSGSDLSGELAERYGYVNRALPDAELDGFVDALARRIASFDKQSLSEIKTMVNVSTLPPIADLNNEWSQFIASVQRPEAQKRIARLKALGLGQNADLENHLTTRTGNLGLEADH